MKRNKSTSLSEYSNLSCKYKILSEPINSIPTLPNSEETKNSGDQSTSDPILTKNDTIPNATNRIEGITCSKELSKTSTGIFIILKTLDQSKIGGELSLIADPNNPKDDLEDPGKTVGEQLNIEEIIQVVSKRSRVDSKKYQAEVMNTPIGNLSELNRAFQTVQSSRKFGPKTPNQVECINEFLQFIRCLNEVRNNIGGSGP